MAIAVVQEPAGVTADAVTSVTKAFTSSVTNGNLIVVQTARGITNTAIVVGNCTKSAGTATVGTITLDQQASANSGTPNQSGVWSVPVTGTGSCTMQVAGAAGSYFAFTIGEYSGTDISASRVESTNSNSSTTAVTPATTGNATSAGEALFVAALSVDANGGGSVNTWTVGNSFVERYEELDSTNHQCGETDRLLVGTGTTTQGTWALTASGGFLGWSCCVVAYKVAPASSGAAWTTATRQAPGQKGPFDPLGFLAQPKYSYVQAPAATTIYFRRFVDDCGKAGSRVVWH